MLYSPLKKSTSTGLLYQLDAVPPVRGSTIFVSCWLGVVSALVVSAVSGSAKEESVASEEGGSASSGTIEEFSVGGRLAGEAASLESDGVDAIKSISDSPLVSPTFEGATLPSDSAGFLEG